jgi:hypothetical protein
MKRYRFRAKVEAAGVGKGGAYVLFPFDVEKEFGAKGRVPVKATFNGVPYSGSLTKCGSAEHMLGILKGVRQRIGVELGDTVEVEVWRDDQPRTLQVPADFREAIQGQGVASFFDRLSYTHRQEYCRWITEARRSETRSKRIEKAVAMLRNRVPTPDT